MRAEARAMLFTPTFAVATISRRSALCLAHNGAGKRLVFGGDIPREFFGILHGSGLLSIFEVNFRFSREKNFFSYLKYYYL